ncbi:hypothetical protein MKX03_005280 [Papaver bracteatum]|nr:hypothetical protein MKX03_005280 [Papaver bracteatum]
MEAEGDNSPVVNMEAEGDTSTAALMAKLKIAGAWSGVLEIDLREWTVMMLREEIAKRSGSSLLPNSINLICGGKVMKDDENQSRPKLSELGFVKKNSKILASRISASDNVEEDPRTSFKKEEERATTLARIKDAAVSLARRHAADGSLPVENFNMELENQNGETFQLGSETDRQGLMMGLMLHTNGKHLIKQQKYREALDVLNMGEESFALCDSVVIEMIDNAPILQIDMVWCYFMLKDIKWLSMAGVRLEKARKGLERSHGKDSSRVRILQGGTQPEVALYLRLELLEGVVAYHSGQTEKALKSLNSAQAKYIQLQVPDEALSMLMSMGYGENEAKRALRMNNQNIERAAEFLVEEYERDARRREEDIRREKEIREQKKYGVTALNKAVDLQRLDELVSIGFEKELAAEALRRNENDFQMALDELTNPEKFTAIQVLVASKKRKRLGEHLVRMGFDRSRVVEALRNSVTKEQALNILTSQAPNNAITDSAPPTQLHNNEGSSSNLDHVDATGGSSSSGVNVNENTEEIRDVEMEHVLAHELTGDPYEDYDIEVTKEGEAVTEYLALLASSSTPGV